MEMVPWSAFYSLVRPDVHGCPFQYVDAAIRAATIEFCTRTKMWKQGVVAGDLIRNLRSYKLNSKYEEVAIVSPESMSLVDTVMNSSTGGCVENRMHFVKSVSFTDLEVNSPNWRSQSAEWPTQYYMKSPNEFIFVEKPTQDKYKAIHVMCAMKPSRTATKVPYWLYEDWAETIAHGALARLHAFPGRVWAKPDTVMFHRNLFRAGITEAKVRDIKSYTTRSTTVLPRNYFN